MRFSVPSIDLIISLAEAIDLVSPTVANHHKQVSYISYYLAKEYGLSPVEQREVAFAGALHDVGGLSLKDRLDALQFEYNDYNFHAEKGYLLLNTFKSFSNIALMIRYHHTSWEHGNSVGVNNEDIPLGSRILYLADRISVLIDSDNFLLSHVDEICKKIVRYSGKVFMPELVNTFLQLSKRECFWLDIQTISLSHFLKEKMEWDHSIMEERDFSGLIMLFSRIIDFRSHFTATHSSAVAATAEVLARIAGFSDNEVEMMRIAGYVHDLGKLVIPSEILEKPAALTKDEYAIIRSHTYYTNRVLAEIHEFDTIRQWSAFHHERLDGSGYPYHLKGDEIPLGARIMAVADIFAALMEDRPYRKGMKRNEALDIIQKMADDNAIDGSIVKILKNNYYKINMARMRALHTALKEYNQFKKAFLEAASRKSIL